MILFQIKFFKKIGSHSASFCIKLAIFIRRRNFDTGIQGECHVNFQAEVGVICLQAKKHQILTVVYQQQDQGYKADYPLQSPEKNNSANPLISEFWFPEL